MKLIAPHGVLAAPVGDTGANKFLDSPIGTAVIGLCGAVAIVIVVVCIFRMIKSVTSGRPGEGFKILVFGLIIGGLLFNLNLTVKGVNQMSGLVGKVFDSVGSITS